MDLESPEYAGAGMYRENIMDHYSNPRNKGILEKADIKFHDCNTVCGDEIDWFVTLDGNEISNIKFQGKGCAISQASISMLTEVLDKKNIDEVFKITDNDMFDLLGIQLSAMRIKCALLGLRSLQKALIIYKSEEKNE